MGNFRRLARRACQLQCSSSYVEVVSVRQESNASYATVHVTTQACSLSLLIACTLPITSRKVIFPTEETEDLGKVYHGREASRRRISYLAPCITKSEYQYSRRLSRLCTKSSTEVVPIVFVYKRHTCTIIYLLNVSLAVIQRHDEARFCQTVLMIYGVPSMTHC